jgi:hypothetical protein
MHRAVLTAKIIQRSFVIYSVYNVPCHMSLTMSVTGIFVLCSACDVSMYRDSRIPCELRPGSPTKACCG